MKSKKFLPPLYARFAGLWEIGRNIKNFCDTVRAAGRITLSASVQSTCSFYDIKVCHVYYGGVQGFHFECILQFSQKGHFIFTYSNEKLCLLFVCPRGRDVSEIVGIFRFFL